MEEPVSAPAPAIGQDSPPTEGLEHVRRYLWDVGEIHKSVIGGPYFSLVSYLQGRLQ